MRTTVVLAALATAAVSAAAQRTLPRVFVTDTTVVPSNPDLVWLPNQLRMKPALFGGMRLVYPDSLRREGISGRVTLEFVVDTLGRVEPGVRVVSTAHPSLVAPAKEMLQGARFVPGRVRGRPVRVLMRMGLRVARETR